MSKDMQKTEEKTNRRMPTFTESVIPIIAMMVILTVGKGYLGYATEPLLLLVAAIAGLIAYRVGVTWDEMMDEICQKIAKGMPAILILTFAWTLKAMTDSLGAAEYVAGVMETAATGLVNFLPAIIFLVGCFLAFATGTSWGTFGILIPIVVAVFQGTNETMMIISISACMAGAVCGDHCSPISDTTIMASAGAQCNHVNHVSTQLPYAMTVAAVSCITYVIAGILQNAVICLVIGIALQIGVLLAIKAITKDHTGRVKTTN